MARVIVEQGGSLILLGTPRSEAFRTELAGKLPGTLVLNTDVTNQADVNACRDFLQREWETLDGVVYSVAGAEPGSIRSQLIAVGQEEFELAMNVSAYSLIRVVRTLRPLMHKGGSVVGVSFNTPQVWPSYGLMGICKAALEMITKVLAVELGPEGIRVNTVSTGPYRTQSSAALEGFKDLIKQWGTAAPLGWNVNDVSGAANLVLFLLSELSSQMTGEVLYVDGGFRHLGGGTPASSFKLKGMSVEEVTTPSQ